MTRASVPALAVLLLACSEATAPATGTFRAQIQGATVATLTGASNAGPIYTEDSPEGSYVIGMFTPRGDTVISISIRCPNNEPLPPGTYAIDTSASTCPEPSAP